MNDQTVRYTISLDGFKYHVKKGVLKIGSTISKKEHPIKEVEDLKKKLVDHNLVDRGDCYICKTNVHTGLLMAYNLHCGELKKTIDLDKQIVINGKTDEDSDIKDFFALKGIVTADNTFKDTIFKDCIRVKKLFQIEYDNSFLKNTRDGSFSKVEQFVVDALRTAGIIETYRRGNPEKKESDIIDIGNNRQIEVVCLLDDKIPKDFRQRNSVNGHYALLLEYINPDSIIISDGVLKKFTARDYTDDYPKNLAVYILGTSHDAAKKLEQLINKIMEISTLKNTFQRIYMIIHDPLIEESFTIVSDGICNTYPDSRCSTNIIQRGEIVDKISDNEAMYFLLEEDIFSGREAVNILKGSELNDWRLSFI